MLNVAEVKQKILNLLKERGEATTAEIASNFEVSYEAIRQQLKQLEAAQLVERHGRPNPSGVGRPLRYYTLSAAGDHLFPKQYDELAVELLDAIGDELGPVALRRVLTAITDRQVTHWAAQLEGKSLSERLEALKDFYVKDDPYTEVRKGAAGLQLVERNCPFLSTALQRPALCSVTVSTLERLLGRRVSREKRFQHGDGCCVFHVHVDEPLEPEAQPFRFEEVTES